MRNYSQRHWLNEGSHSSTGSVVAFSGKAAWGYKGKREETTFLEISDCHAKVKLHRSGCDTMEEFIEKMQKLRDVVDAFVAHLRKEGTENG